MPTKPNSIPRRIQQAMDTCPKGQAVVLKADGALNAFLTGPLDLKPGVTLVVDAKTILFGSRDAKVYEVQPRQLRHRIAGRPRLPRHDQRRPVSRTPA